MKISAFHKSEIPALVDHLSGSYQVLGPKRKAITPAFGEIQDPSDLVLEYTTTILPPKKFFMPPHEILFKFETATQKAELPPPIKGKRILLGVHPCDMAGIRLLDWAFTEGQAEANWIERRRAATIFGITQIPDDQCFSESVGTNDPENGFDGFFFDNGENYLVAIYTEKGEEALQSFKKIKTSDFTGLEKARLNFNQISSGQTLKLAVPLSDISAVLKRADNSPEWERLAGRCLSCGSCTIICSTCFCFDVEDQLNLTMTGGVRVRKWDSCQLRDFTSIAGGYTFQKKRETRIRHRIYRKYRYLTDKLPGHPPFCVGCGRCNRACTAGINIVEIINNVCRQALVGG